MELIYILLAIVGGLSAWLIYEKNKLKGAEALNDNLETKEKVDEIQKGISKNEALIEVEKEKQDELKKKLEEDKAKNVSKDDLLDFFNKSNK